MELDCCAFFQGVYDNRWNCYLPRNYLGESIPPTLFTEDHILITSLKNKCAVLVFIQLFPESTFKQQQAFMKTGFPLLQLFTLQLTHLQK